MNNETTFKLSPAQEAEATRQYHLGYAFAYNLGRPTAAANRNAASWKSQYVETCREAFLSK